MENNRQRVSIPISGLDTSNTDINAPDGAMEVMHNFRYSGNAWRNVSPFKVREQCGVTDKLTNTISMNYDSGADEYYILSQFPVASDITITAYWWDVDGEEYSTTTAVLKKGEAKVHIQMAQESAGKIEINVNFDETYIYQVAGSTPPQGIEEEVIYQHPADEEDVYISRKISADGKTVALLRVRIKDGAYGVLSTIAEGLPTDVKVSHFGKILILLSDQQKTREYYRLLTTGSYRRFESPRPPVVRQSTELADRSDELSGTLTHTLIEPITAVASGGTGKWRVKLYDAQEEVVALPQHKSDNAFCGEICYFAIYQMADGSLLAPGALNISSSEPFYHGAEGMQYIGWNGLTKFACPTFTGDDDIYIETYHQYIVNSAKDVVFPWSFAISPYITITIPEGIDEELIRYVNIYSTRINSIWDTRELKNLSNKRKEYLASKKGNEIDTFWQDNNWSTAYGLFADNELQEQPFYLMESIPIGTIQSNGNVHGMRITAKMLENIEQKKKYESVEAHTMYTSKLFEFNGRMHAFINSETQLFPGYGGDVLVAKDGDRSGKCAVEIKYDTETYAAYVDMSGSLQGNIVHSRCLSYPDSRATYIYNNSAYKGRNILTSARNNNFAVSTWSDPVGGSTSDFVGDVVTSDPYPLYARMYVKYSAIYPQADINATQPSAKNTPPGNNKLRVSAPNNPFVFPLANSYAIGTEDNEIIAMNSAAIEMSDAKFGEFPLYAFTKEGIFAMQLGSGEVLYSAIVPINYDKVINPNTLAVNHNVLYITSRGVHAMFSNESALVSTPINDAANRPLLGFLATAEMAYQHKYGEVILFNNSVGEHGQPKYPNAYTFSLDSKTWATRDWSDRYILRKLISRDATIEQYGTQIIVSELNEEDTKIGSRCRLVSRPIKFGSQEFKRIETLITRLQDDNYRPEMTIRIEASNDLDNWVTCREVTTSTKNDLVIRRTPFSARYFRISIDCHVPEDIAINGFDVEYYLRFIHRMR